MSSGDVFITIADNAGAQIQVPQSSVQVVIGVSSAGTTNTVVATRSPATLQSTFGYGPLVEAASYACNAGGLVLAIRVPTVTLGTASTVTFTGTGTSVITKTLDGTQGAFDTYYLKFKVIAGGTIGTAGITFQISLDAGRTYGPILSLGAANTYVIPNTGITLNFAAGTLVAGDTATIGTVEPKWNTSGIQAALNALNASQYAVTGWGSMHIVGTSSGSDASAIEGYLDTLATGYVFTRAFLSARDASPPAAYGGTGETDSAWGTAIQTDYSSVNAKRLCVGAGYYNMASSYTNTAAGTPRYRRPIAWAAAARAVKVPPQRHIGRVKDGALSQIFVDAANDPLDGFVYHDERVNPGLDYITAGTGGRFMSVRSRTGLPGIYVSNPVLMGSLPTQFTILPLGSVMDIACSIVHTVGQQDINSDVRCNPSGTIYETAAQQIESTLLEALNDQMTAPGMISSATVVVDRTNNVLTTSQVNVTVTITARGYIFSENVTIAFANSLAAQAS